MTEPTRVALYASFATRGRAPTVPELAQRTGQSVPAVRAALVALHQSRDIVLSPQALEAFSRAVGRADMSTSPNPNADPNADPNPGPNTDPNPNPNPNPTGPLQADTHPHTILMAHPFSSLPLGFSVMGRRTLWWGGCAWDAFALPHLLPDEAPVLVATRCPGCERAMALDVGVDAPPGPKGYTEQHERPEHEHERPEHEQHEHEQPEHEHEHEQPTHEQPKQRGQVQGSQPAGPVAHFLLPTTRMWDDVVHTCAHQRLFCTRACVDAWLARTGNTRGYVMDLDTLWHLARGWYAGRLEGGYRRREPGAAKRYFGSVGLKGAFWGLDE